MLEQTENIKSKKKSKLINLFFITAAVITVIGFFYDIHSTITYPGTDLRNRVVGARLMLEGIDPYFFKWQPEFSERFYDPLDVPTQILSKLSVPPTVLVLHSLFAGLTYLQQKILWLLVQWGALIGTILVFLKASNFPAKTNLVWITSFLFTNSLFWRFHVNSGQIYIIYVFLLSIAWVLLKKASDKNILLSGLFVGITIGLRPSFILLLIPFIIGRQYLFLLGSVFGTTASVCLSLLVAGISIWQKYILSILGMTGFLDLSAYVPAKEKAIFNFDIVYPQVYEGFNINMRNPLEEYIGNSSIRNVLNILDLSNKRYLLVIGFAIAIIILSLYIWRFYRQNKNINFLFLWGILTCFICEFFIPVGRYSYYDIQLILPILIAIDLTTDRLEIRDLIYRKSMVILLLGFYLGIAGFFIIHRALLISTFLIMLYITLMCFTLFDKNSKNTHKILKN